MRTAASKNTGTDTAPVMSFSSFATARSIVERSSRLPEDLGMARNGRHYAANTFATSV
jgi:hypothetical protein